MSTPNPDPVPAPPVAVPVVPVFRPSRFAGWWYLPLTILSAGVLAWVPFLHAAIRLSRPRLLLWSAFCLAVLVTALALPVRPAGGEVEFSDALPGLLMIVMIPIASIRQWSLRRNLVVPIWPVAPTAPTPPASAPLDPAVARVLAARARRNDARELAAADPLMARELRIGRPDLPRTYDDGGLVDLNSAPAPVIAQVCQLDQAAAQSGWVAHS
jgi:hypothetical protein